MFDLPRSAMDRETRNWLGALEPARRAMHAWAGGLVLLSAVVLTAPEAPVLVSAAAEEAPRVTVRTLRAPEAPKKAAAAPARSRVAASRSTYRRQAAVAPKKIARRSARSRVVSPRAETAESLNLRAYRLQKRGRHAAAEPLLREALRKRPEFPYAQYNLGWSLVSQGKAGEAILYLKKTAQAQPKRHEPLDKLAEAYERLGRKQEATEARNRAQELRRPSSQKRADAGADVQAKVAVAPVAWRQSTDHREDAWLRERRELAAAPAPTAPER